MRRKYQACAPCQRTGITWIAGRSWHVLLPHLIVDIFSRKISAGRCICESADLAAALGTVLAEGCIARRKVLGRKLPNLLVLHAFNGNGLMPGQRRFYVWTTGDRANRGRASNDNRSEILDLQISGLADQGF